MSLTYLYYKNKTEQLKLAFILKQVLHLYIKKGDNR